MSTFEITTRSPEETRAWGKTLARYLKPGDIICLTGDLGAGKTTFVKGLAEGLKISPRRVNSPTFVIMNRHRGRLPLYHFDFYRLEAMEEIQSVGYEEFLYGDGIAVIEWADRMGRLIPLDRMDIHFRHLGKDRRELKARTFGRQFGDIFSKLQ